MKALVYFLEIMLRHPIAILAPGLVVAILYGAGKAMGLPRLFWNERPLNCFLAGLASTLLAAESFLVAYLLDGAGILVARTSFICFLLVGGAVWLLLVGVRIFTLPSASPTSRRARAGWTRGVSPAIRTVDDQGLAGTRTSQVPAGEFMAGVGVAAVFVVLLVALTLRILAPELPELAQRQTSDPELHFLALICFILFLAAFVLLRRCATPAVGLCILLSLVLSVDAAIEFWLHSAGLGALLLLGLLWWSGALRYKLRVPALADLYGRPVRYPPLKQEPAPKAAPLPFDVALDAKDGKPRRLIVVCASGGGIRAATWTAAILGQLDEIEGFRSAARLITGASGGMMGAASWLAFLAKEDNASQPLPAGTWQDLMKAVSMDSLTSVAQRLVFRDIPMAFMRRNNLADRARALEESWCKNLQDSKLKIDLGVTFGQLRGGEESGRWPSLVLSPMLVEDGRRLIISNLDLTKSTENFVRWLSSKETGTRPVSGRASQTAYHLHQLWPDGWERFPLSTAARLSAAFPYVSSAVILPTEPRRRVVDAGYYDNYGLELACNWLRELLEIDRPLLERSVSGILVIQIRDNVSQLSVNPDDPKRPIAAGRGDGSSFSRSLEGLTSPPEGLLTARESVTLFRNDAQLELVSHMYATAFGSEDFLTTTVFEFGGEASLSWHLAKDEVDLIQQQAQSKGIRLKLDAIRAWLGERDYWGPGKPRASSGIR